MNKKQQLLMKFIDVSKGVRTLKDNMDEYKMKNNIPDDKDKKFNDKDKEFKTDNSKNIDFKKFKMKMSGPTKEVFYLLLKEGSLNQRSIASRIGVSPQAISLMIKKLETKGIIKKEQGVQHNENIITLTEDGKEFASQVENYIGTVSNSVFENFTEDEMSTFSELLEKIKQNSIRKIENMKDEDK